MYRLIVTGGRDLPEAEVVWLPLWMMLHQEQAMIVVHGACPTGADLYAHEWFSLPEQPFNRARRRYEKDTDYLAIEEQHPPDFSKGSYANNIRNQDMVSAGADSVFAFPTPRSEGTLDCVARAWVRGLPVFVWHHLQPGRYHRLSDEDGERLAKRKLGWPSSAVG